MIRVRTSIVIAGIAAIALVALAFVVAPHACKGGFEFYFWCGVVVLAFLLAVPFIGRVGNSLVIRIAIALGFVLFGTGAWLAGLLAANVRFICGLGYL